jgi:hypothetical protein
VYANFIKLKKSLNLWSFSSYLSDSCSKPYTEFEAVLKNIEDESLKVLQVSNHFIDYKMIQSKLKEGKDEQKSQNKMEKLQKSAV